jgi:hypothetical protein
MRKGRHAETGGITTIIKRPDQTGHHGIQIALLPVTGGNLFILSGLVGYATMKAEVF